MQFIMNGKKVWVSLSKKYGGISLCISTDKKDVDELILAGLNKDGTLQIVSALDEKMMMENYGVKTCRSCMIEYEDGSTDSHISLELEETCSGIV